MHRNPACPTKAPFGASPTLRLRQLYAANLVVQLDVPSLLPTTKSWPDRDVSTSELNHKNALERVRGIQGGLGEQSQAPLVPLGRRQAMPTTARYRGKLHRLLPLTAMPELYSIRETT